MKALKYVHNVRKTQRDLYFMFGCSAVDLELLTSLAILIMKSGKVRHHKDAITKNATRPRKSGQFMASFQTLIDKGWIIKHKARNGYNYGFSDEGLMIVERYDYTLTEYYEGEPKGKTSVNDIINGLLN